MDGGQLSSWSISWPVGKSGQCFPLQRFSMKNYEAAFNVKSFLSSTSRTVWDREALNVNQHMWHSSIKRMKKAQQHQDQLSSKWVELFCLWTFRWNRSLTMSSLFRVFQVSPLLAGKHPGKVTRVFHCADTKSSYQYWGLFDSFQSKSSLPCSATG